MCLFNTNFQGHDTTASALLWIIHLIGKHPEVQTKLQNEADSFFGKNQWYFSQLDEFFSSYVFFFFTLLWFVCERLNLPKNYDLFQMLF